MGHKRRHNPSSLADKRKRHKRERRAERKRRARVQARQADRKPGGPVLMSGVIGPGIDITWVGEGPAVLDELIDAGEDHTHKR